MGKLEDLEYREHNLYSLKKLIESIINTTECEITYRNLIDAQILLSKI